LFKVLTTDTPGQADDGERKEVPAVRRPGGQGSATPAPAAAPKQTGAVTEKETVPAPTKGP